MTHLAKLEELRRTTKRVEGKGPLPTFVKFDGMTENFVAAVESGSTLKMAAAANGVSEHTVYNWLVKGRDARAAKEAGEAPLTDWDDEYIEFLVKIEEAEMVCQNTLLGRIFNAGETNWTANAWILERRFNWTKQDKVVHQGPDGKNVKVDFTLNLGERAENISNRMIENTKKAEDADFEIVDDNGGE